MSWIGAIVGAFAAVAILLSTSGGLLPTSPEVVSYLWRVAQVSLVVVALASSQGRALSKQGFAYFSAWLLALVIIALANFDQLEPWLMLARNVILAIVFCVCYGTRSDDVRTALAVMLEVVLWGGLLLATYAVLPLLADGWSWEASRQLKSEAQSQRSQMFNTTMFAVAICISLHRSRGFARLLLVAYFAFLCIATATRTPLVALLAAMVVPRLTQGMTGRGKGLLQISLGLLAIALPLGFVFYLTQSPDPDIARTLAGRLYLWQAGVEQWLTAPLLGDSGTAYRAALDRAYPMFMFLAPWEAEVLYDIDSGGFHSIWIQTLAIGGVVGGIGVLISYTRLIKNAVALGAAGAVLVISLCLVRSFTEYSGLFSSGNSPLDFLCVAALAYGFNQSGRST